MLDALQVMSTTVTGVSVHRHLLVDFLMDLVLRGAGLLQRCAQWLQGGVEYPREQADADNRDAGEGCKHRGCRLVIGNITY